MEPCQKRKNNQPRHTALIPSIRRKKNQFPRNVAPTPPRSQLLTKLETHPRARARLKAFFSSRLASSIIARKFIRYMLRGDL